MRKHRLTHSTIARRASKFSVLFRPNKNMSLVSIGTKNYRVGTSKTEDIWLNKLNIHNRQKVFYGFQGKVLVVDGVDEQNKIAFEFLGEHAHGSHKLFKTNRDSVIWLGKTPNQLYYETLDRFNFLNALGYRVFFVWYRDYKNGFVGRYYRGKGDNLY